MKFPRLTYEAVLGEGRREQGVDADSQRKTVEFFFWSRYEKRDVGELYHDEKGGRKTKTRKTKRKVPGQSGKAWGWHVKSATL